MFPLLALLAIGFVVYKVTQGDGTAPAGPRGNAAPPPGSDKASDKSTFKPILSTPIKGYKVDIGVLNDVLNADPRVQVEKALAKLPPNLQESLGPILRSYAEWESDWSYFPHSAEEVQGLGDFMGNTYGDPVVAGLLYDLANKIRAAQAAKDAEPSWDPFSGISEP